MILCVVPFLLPLPLYYRYCCLQYKLTVIDDILYTVDYQMISLGVFVTLIQTIVPVPENSVLCHSIVIVSMGVIMGVLWPINRSITT